MCQMRVLLNTDGKQEKIMDTVARLEVTREGIVLSVLFEKPLLIPAAQIKEIDFLDGVVVLTQTEG